MPFSAFDRFLRKSIVVSIGILILLIGIILVGFGKTSEDKMNAILNSNLDCINIITTESDVLSEKSLANSQKLDTSCYCFNNILTLGTDATSKLKLSDGTLPCATYISAMTDYNLFKLIIAIGLPVINHIFGLLKCIL